MNFERKKIALISDKYYLRFPCVAIRQRRFRRSNRLLLNPELYAGSCGGGRWFVGGGRCGGSSRPVRRTFGQATVDGQGDCGVVASANLEKKIKFYSLQLI
jgi:hypothetical protein